MTLRRLQYFVAVAEELSFTRAAHRLHMAQPPLSTQIRDLERELGVDLFDRGHRSITLTAAGRAALPEARQLLDRYEAIGRMARRAEGGEVGRLAIGLIPSAANGRLPTLLTRFTADLPDVDVTLIEDRPPQLLRLLEAGHIDIVLQYSKPADDRFDSAIIATERLLLAVPSGHRLARRKRVPITILADQPLILPTSHDGEGLHERITALLARHRVAARVIHDDIWLMQTIIGLVSAGTGLALVPESAAVIRSAQVTYLPLSDVAERVPLVAVWRTADSPPTVERFIALCGPEPDATRI